MAGLFGQVIKKEYPQGKVVNASVWGYSSWQGLKRFNEIVQYEPDMVLISFGSNDPCRVITSDREYLRKRNFSRFWFAKLKTIQFYFAASDRIKRAMRKNQMLIPRVSLKEYESNIDRIIDIAQKRGIKIVLLTRPFIGESSHLFWWKNFAPEYNSLTSKIAETREVGFIDLYSDFKDGEYYFVDESHFNDSGFRLAAKLIYSKIQSLFY